MTELDQSASQLLQPGRAAPASTKPGEVLAEALERMDRARDILTDRRPTHNCNWGMLDTSDLRAALAAPEAPAGARAGDGNSKAVEAAHLFRLIDDFLKPHGWAAQKLLRDYVELVKTVLAAAPAVSAPVEWRKAVQEAYGWLWHINNEPLAPIPLLSDGEAAYQARKALRDLLTSAERGEAINAVTATIDNIKAAAPGFQAPGATQAAPANPSTSASTSR